MSKKLFFVLTAVIMCLCFALSACGQGGNNSKSSDDDTYYTVTFDSRGGSPVESQRVLAGNPATAPDTPTKEKFDFDGWYLSISEDAARWNFAADRVNENITLYAHWTEKQETPAPSETLTFDESGNGFIVTGDSGQSTAIVIPETHDGLPVTGIGESAFAYSRHPSDIFSVTIPDSVESIGLNAFHNRSKLTGVKLSENSRLKTIGNNAFSGCGALTSFYLPSSCTTLGNDVFNNCGGLNTISVAAENATYSGEGGNLIERATGTLIRGSNTSVIPETVIKIGVAAFRRATLTELTIPTSVTYIEKYAIEDSAIEKVIYKGTSADWESKVVKSPYWNMGKESVEIVCSDTPQTNILVAYFSCTGNTEKIAGYISEITGGEKYEIMPEQPYTEEDLNYGSSSSRTAAENSDPHARPAISGSVENMEKYDVVYLGYPIWYGSAPKIIYTFLESYDFSGKTIIPFCTSASSSIGSSAKNLHSLAASAIWNDGKRFPINAAKGEVETWINGLKP